MQLSGTPTMAHALILKLVTPNIVDLLIDMLTHISACDLNLVFGMLPLIDEGRFKVI